MSCKVYNDGALNYVKIINGKPHVYCGVNINDPETLPNICQTGTIDNDFTITFIDEAHPLYVVGSGNIGSMWGPDVYYYAQNIPEGFPSCANIIFDVDTPFVARGTYKGVSITSDPFYVYPTGVTESSPEGCELPIPELNIVQIPRPSGGLEYDGVTTSIGTISQTTFKDYIITAIENIWGNTFWSRMAASSNKIWIIRENGVSLGEDVIQNAIDLFKTYLTSQGIDYTEHFPECNDTDRYLGWITDCITYDGADVSCTGLFIPPNIKLNNIQGSGDNSDPNATNKLVVLSLEGYSTSGGGQFGDDYLVEITPAMDSLTTWSTNLWSIPSNDYVGFYRHYTPEAASDYYYSVWLYYENGIHKAGVDVYCYGPPFYETGDNKTQQYWKCVVPLDKYGIPNGTLQADDLEFEVIGVDTSGNPTTCRPTFPNITFTSYTPSSFTSPNGIDCTQFNQ